MHQVAIDKAPVGSWDRDRYLQRSPLPGTDVCRLRTGHHQPSSIPPALVSTWPAARSLTLALAWRCAASAARAPPLSLSLSGFLYHSPSLSVPAAATLGTGKSSRGTCSMAEKRKGKKGGGSGHQSACQPRACLPILPTLLPTPPKLRCWHTYKPLDEVKGSGKREKGQGTLVS